MKLDIQMFGGRGASSSASSSNANNKPDVRIRKTTVKGGNFSNRNNMVNYIKEQIDVDLNKAATERQFAPRAGINIDSRKLSINEFNSLRSFAAKNDVLILENGVNDYFIRFKKR